ncbi:MAG: YjbF family lipoprotein [Luteibacter sp.]
MALPETQRAWVALRHLLSGGLALALLLLAGCSSVSRGSIESVRLAFSGEKVNPTPASVAASPYFQLQANSPAGEAILILAKTERGELGWYGSGHDIVFTRDGLVARTVGLPQNLDASAFPGDNPFRAGLQHLAGPTGYTRRMDWSPGYRYGVILQGQLVPKAMEDVEILGTVRRLRRVDESLSGPGVHLSNRYWVDPADGFIWKSRQYVAPDYPLELIQLRPYRETAS